MSADLRKRAFARAAEIVGGSRELAEYLGTDLKQLERWARSSKPPPLPVLRALARVLMHAVTQSAKRSRRRDKSSRKA
jgi:transcriptional regulator with XRE-family HTH domain